MLGPTIYVRNPHLFRVSVTAQAGVGAGHGCRHGAHGAHHVLWLPDITVGDGSQRLRIILRYRRGRSRHKGAHNCPGFAAQEAWLCSICSQGRGATYGDCD